MYHHVRHSRGAIPHLWVPAIWTNNRLVGEVLEFLTVKITHLVEVYLQIYNIRILHC